MELDLCGLKEIENLNPLHDLPTLDPVADIVERSILEAQ